MTPSRPSYICARCTLTALRNQTPRTTRSSFSTTTSASRESNVEESSPEEEVPRWARTPRAMQMPIRLRPQPNQPVWRVNDKPEVLDEVYDQILGKLSSTRGSEMLDSETKWLAVTHRSFDHGRRGFNDRLAFLGKRIVDLQTSLALLNAPASPFAQTARAKHVFQHPSLDGLENVTTLAKRRALDTERLAQLAYSYGLNKVVRWKPKKSNNLQGSGIDTVMSHAIYSIVGAIALKQGGEVAARLTREKVLQPLGFR